IFLFNVANFFNRRKLMLIFLPAQLFHITYVVIAGWLSQFKSYTWKNRINR
ncbi:MAG TPA: glycosyl transferase family 2, partial [Bacteroidetes bacterium]|nr:glycosyl transferase family 2 [Bacteroidota bacterium]